MYFPILQLRYLRPGLVTFTARAISYLRSSLGNYVTPAIIAIYARNLPVLCLNWLPMNSGSNHVSLLPSKTNMLLVT